MADFKKALPKLLVNEGGYVNDPDDDGGETYKGIARNIWPKWAGWVHIDYLKKLPGFPGNIDKDPTVQGLVPGFYETNFWDPIQGDHLTSDDVAFTIFDFAVNGGPGTSKELARIAAGSDLYSTNEINLLESEHFMAAFTLAKITRYIGICRKKPVKKKYFFNWITRAMGV